MFGMLLRCQSMCAMLPLHCVGCGLETDLVIEANKNAKWIFGLDGLPKDSHKYRVNQDGNKLYEMMKLGVSMGIFVSWQYIVIAICTFIVSRINIR